MVSATCQGLLYIPSSICKCNAQGIYHTHVYVLGTAEYHVPIHIPKYISVNSIMANVDRKILVRHVKFKKITLVRHRKNGKSTQRFNECRRGSTATVTPKMKLFMAVVNNLQPLIIVIKSSILDTAEILDPPLVGLHFSSRAILFVE